MNKRISLALAPLTAIALLSTFSCDKKSPQYEVTCNPSSVIISNATATQGEDYITELSVDFTKEELGVTLPETLESVKSGNRVLSIEKKEYIYTTKEYNTKAEIKIPKEYIEGAVYIELYLNPAPNFISETEFEDAISFKDDEYLQCTSFEGETEIEKIECSPEVFYDKKTPVYDETYVANHNESFYTKCSRSSAYTGYADWGEVASSEWKTPEDVNIIKEAIESVELTYEDFEFDNKTYTCSATYPSEVDPDLDDTMTLKFDSDKKLISLEKSGVYSDTYSIVCTYGHITPRYPTKTDWVWYKDSDYLDGLTDEDIGIINVVKVNNVAHAVRLIGVDEDVDGSDNNIHTTWEFANLISDKNGYSLATYWNDVATKATAAHNYTTSTLRAALVGEGGATINWFQYFGTEHDTDDNLEYSSEYSNISVLDMLPTALTDVLKTPKKKVYIKTGSDPTEEVITTDKLFALGAREIGQKSGGEPTTAPYTFYENGFNEREIRIKHQVKRHDGARDGGLISVDLDGESTDKKTCYAGYDNGYNSITKVDEGGWYMLRSPGPYFNGSSLSIGCTGLCNQTGYPANTNAGAVAPAFCI